MPQSVRPRTSSLSTRMALAVSFLLGLLAVAVPGQVASAETAFLTSDGTLFEVFIAPYENVVPGAAVTGHFAAQDFPVVALRTTRPGGSVVLDVVDGTFTSEPKGLPSVAVDESTGTVIVCYSKYVGLMSDLHVAVRRDGGWASRDIRPSAGIYLSLNPRLAATRQQYVDFDGKGGTVTKSRTIFSLVWWEESGPSQARYAPIFVEDGILSVDAIVAYNLNDIVGKQGFTDIGGLPFSSYMFPAVERDLSSSSGGVLVSFANLVTRREQVISITFPGDLTKIPGASGASGTSGSSGLPEAQVRGHIPVGRELGGGPLRQEQDTPTDVGYFLSSTGKSTSWWTDSTGVHYFRNDAPAGDQPKLLLLRPDFPVDRALSLIRDMTLTN